MNSKGPDTTSRPEQDPVSAAWLRVLDLGVSGNPPPTRESLALRVLAGLADCMP